MSPAAAIRGVLIWVLLAITTAPSAADTPVAARTIRAGTVLTLADLTMAPGEVPGAITDPGLIAGLEARVALYAGRPIMAGDVGPPALVERNGIVRLVYDVGGLSIVTEGRALGRAGAGDTLRVMNLASRATVTGYVRPDGAVVVGLAPGM